MIFGITAVAACNECEVASLLKMRNATPKVRLPCGLIPLIFSLSIAGKLGNDCGFFAVGGQTNEFLKSELD